MNGKTSKMIYMTILLAIIPTIGIPMQEADALPTGNFRITSIDSTVVVLAWNDINNAIYYQINMARDDGDLGLRTVDDDSSRIINSYHEQNEGDVIKYNFAAYDINWNLVGEHTVNGTVPTNQTPTINAGNDKTKDGNERVRLPTSVSDEHPEDLTYSWTEIDGKNIDMSCITCDVLSVKAPDTDVTKTFNFRVVTTDMNGASAEDTVTLTVLPTRNGSPTADPGPDRTISELETTILYGAQSYDSDGEIASYSWNQVRGIANTLSDANIDSPVFIAPSVTQDTVFIYALTVTDNDGDSATKRVRIFVLNVMNVPPVANAGTDQHMSSGDQITLDGSQSYDIDITAGGLTYTWMQQSGTIVSLSATDVPKPTFVAPTLTDAEKLTFVLKVEDGLGGMDMDRVNVIITDNAGPTADAESGILAAENAGSGILATEYDQITLDGRGSIVSENENVSYRWDIVEPTIGFPNTLYGETATFTLPAVNDNINVWYTLTVTDDYLTSTDTIQILVVQNEDPTSRIDVVAVGNQAKANTAITLYGYAGDINGVHTISYDFTQTRGQTVDLVETSEKEPSSETLKITNTFVAPDVITETELGFRLTVSDHVGESSTSNVLISILPNRDLIADAGDDIYVVPGSSVSIQGSGIDTNGNNQGLEYSWNSNRGDIILTQNNKRVSFTAPDDITTFKLTLSVTDGFNTGTDTVRVIVEANNYLPVVNAGEDQRVTQGDTVTLEGMVSDQDGIDSVSLEWTQIRGNTINIENPTEPTLTFVAPMVNSETTLIFQLSGTDSSNTVSDNVNVVVKPTNSALSILTFPEDQTVYAGSTVSLSATVEDNDDPIRYEWSQQSGWRDITILDLDRADASFIAPETSREENIVVRLSVYAGNDIVTQDVTITVITVPKHTITTEQRYHYVGVNEITNIDITVDNPAETKLYYDWRLISPGDLNKQQITTIKQILESTTTNLSFTVPTPNNVIAFMYIISDGDHRKVNFIYVDSW